MTVAEIINKLKELKGLLDKLCYDVYHHASRHALGGEDEVHIDASQVVSGVLDLARIPDLPRSKITDFFSPPFWENIPDKPSTYPPEPHTHTRSEVTDFFSAPFWENIPDKPSTYPPEPHTHTRSEITDFWEVPFWENIPDKPSEYPPEAHTHSRSDITDFFSAPFWDNIPDKPFSTLGSEFTVVSGELQIASVDWSKVANKPSEYPPESHTHTRSEITDFWSEPFWENIPDKPSQYPPEAHTHTRSEITDFWSEPFWDNIPDKPSVFPPEAHTHSRSDVTDFFSSPFWANIPDKPFSTLGSEFTVSSGELQIASVDWSKIANKPSEYPPEAHTHTRSDITDFWDTPFWDNIPDKPSEYPPEPHTHGMSDLTDFVNVSKVIMDTSTNRPSAGVAGRLFFETDTHIIYYDNGSSWVKLGVADWEDIEGKPSEYPPEAHTHSRSDITDFFASPFWDNIPDKPFSTLGSEFTVSDGELQISSVDWSKVVNKPSTYPPEAHTHTRSEITDFWSEPFWENIPDKPSEYPPEAHTHTRSEITDFWGTPFWTNIPDKPFSTLGSEFTTSDGELQIASVDFSKITNRLSSLITFDSSLVPNADGNYDLGNESYRWRDGYFTRIYIQRDDQWTTLEMKTPYGQMKIYGGYNDGYAYIEVGNADWSGEINGLMITGYDATNTNYIKLYANYVQTRGHLTPMSDNAYDLGSDTLRWRRLYAVDGYFSGVVTIEYPSEYQFGTLLCVKNSGTGEADAYIKIEGGETGEEGIFLYHSGELKGVIESGAYYGDDIAIVSIGKIRFGVSGWPSTTWIANITGSGILPASGNAYDLGNESYKWKDLWLGGKIYIKSEGSYFGIEIGTGSTSDTGYKGIILRRSSGSGANDRTWYIIADDGTYGYGGKLLFREPVHAGMAYVEGGYKGTVYIGPWGRLTLVQYYDADETTTVRDSPPITLRGHYWDGSASQDVDARIYHRVLSTTPTSELVFTLRGVEYFRVGDEGAVFRGSVLPMSDSTYDLGADSLRWRNGHFAGSVYVGDGAIVTSTASDNIHLKTQSDSPFPNVQIFFGDTRYYTFEAGRFYPAKDSMIDLGRFAYRWRWIYTAYQVVPGDPIWVEDFDTDNSAEWTNTNPSLLSVTWDTANSRLILENPSTTNGYAIYKYNGRQFVWNNVQIIYEVEYEEDGIWGGPTLTGTTGEGYIDANTNRTGMRGWADANRSVYPVVGGKFGDPLTPGRHTVVINIIGGSYMEEWVDGKLYWAGYDNDDNLRMGLFNFGIVSPYKPGKRFYVYRIEIRPLAFVTNTTTARVGLFSASGYLQTVADNFTLNASVLPEVDNSFDLGNSSYRWRNAWLSGELYIYNDSSSAVINTKGQVGTGDYQIFAIRAYDANDITRIQVLKFASNVSSDWYGMWYHITKDGGSTWREIFEAVYSGGSTWFRVNGNVEPQVDNVYDLGKEDLRWKDGHFAGTVYASQFIGNIDWNYIQNTPLVGVVLAFDDTEATVTGTTETEVKYFRFVRNSSFFNVKRIRFIVSGYSSSGTGKLKVYIDGTAYATIDLTSTSEGVYQADVDVSSLSDGIHTVSIRLVGGSSSETVVNNYVMAVGLM